MQRIKFKKGKVCQWEPSKGFMFAGKQIYLVGTNYVTSYVCTNFWKDWRYSEIKKDLEKIAEYGLNAVRIPIHWEYAEPSPGKFRSEVIKRFGKFLSMTEELGLFVMPWFLVGVTTMTYDVLWRKGRSFFEEPMRSYAANHIRRFVKEFKNRPNILCWDICDEPEWYSRHKGTDSLPYDTEKFNAWVQKIYNTVKKEDPLHAVTLGFGHVASSNYGIDVHEMSKLLDVMAITAYPQHAQEDYFYGFRSTYFLGWSCRFNDCSGKGIFTCEAPGMSNVIVEETSVARHFRVVLYSNYANSSMGVFPWVWNDFSHNLWTTPPFTYHPVEPLFGMVRENGTAKPSLNELCAFKSFIDKYPPSDWKRICRRAAIVLPSNYTKFAKEYFSQSFHNYIFLRQAGFVVDYIWEQDIKNLSDNIEILVLHHDYHPDVWLKSIEFAKNGGVVICTGGISVWLPELLGIKVEDVIKKKKSFKINGKGLAKEFHGLEIPAGREQCIAKPVSAKVVATDDEKNPLIFVNKLGKGITCYISYPFDCLMEEFTSEEVGVFPMHSLYRNLTKNSNKRLPLECPDPRIELDLLENNEGTILAILINHSKFKVTTSIIKPETGKIINKIEIRGSDIMIKKVQK